MFMRASKRPEMQETKNDECPNDSKGTQGRSSAIGQIGAGVLAGFVSDGVVRFGFD